MSSLPPPPPHRRSTCYRGGFSTSICDLFSNPSRKSDCCAITCCGLFVSDRTHFLALGTHPPPWWKRILINILLPAITCVLFTLLLFIAMDDMEPENASFSFFLIGFGLLCCLLKRGQYHRMRTRRAVMERINAARSQKGEQTSPVIENYDVRKPHDTCFCCCCLANDSIVIQQGTDTEEGDTENAIYHTRHCTHQTSLPMDFCSSLWNLSKLFCCGCVGCWCQCFGICAVGQEDREMQLLLSKQELQLDYVTFEPYRNYFPRILALRHSESLSFREHTTALSKLSCMLVQIFGICVLILAVVAISSAVADITPATLLVFLATFFQAFIVLYVIYWRSNRLDISFDAVVKYFSSGFVICTGLAFAYEILVQIILNAILYVIAILSIVISIVLYGNDQTDQTIDSQFVIDHEIFFDFVAAMSAFGQAFLMAALVEELAKYFGYWMVEHPDFLSPADMVDTTTSTMKGGSLVNEVPGRNISGSLIFEEIILEKVIIEEEIGRGESIDNVDIDSAEDSDQQEEDKRTLVSRGTAIMVAMVATALGFACCENLLYIFGYGESGISNKVAVLTMRSLLPLHPIAAAIQSIGVIRRDIEGNRSYGIGRIFLPAFMYHGSFDFVLMFMSALDKIHVFEEISDKESTKEAHEQEYLEENDLVIDPFFIALSIFLLGIVYYVIEARAQRKRLMDLDTNCQSNPAPLPPMNRLV